MRFLMCWSSVIRASVKWVILFGGFRGGAVFNGRLLLEVGCVVLCVVVVRACCSVPVVLRGLVCFVNGGGVLIYSH
jgi:hypothetical protein